MQTVSKINKDRIFQRVMDLAEIGRVGDYGVQRLALTREDKKAQSLVSTWMEQAGMSVRHDNFGNLIGRREGNNPNLSPVIIGSHIDTVPNGGRFDGTIGVIGGIEVVQAIRDANVHHDHPLEVIAFCDEEGTRFLDGLFGSRGMAGLVTNEHLQIEDASGITRYQALKDFGYNINPDEIGSSIRKPGEIKAYLEMHIEQGPFLEEKDRSVGIVAGISGPAWLNIKISGEAGHAGATPMALRRDPIVGAAKVIQKIEEVCKSASSNTLVGTVGKIQAFPGGRNVIPQTVEFTVDVRDIDENRRSYAIQSIEKAIQDICVKRQLTYELEKLQEIKPVQCSKHIIDAIDEANKELKLNAPIMVSGAGHDAMFLAEITDIGMIFIRCKKGISHNPKEWASKEDIADGTRLLLKTVQRFI